MTVRYSHHFLRQYAAAPAQVRKAFDKQCELLLDDLGYPSLRAKKYHATLGIWQARVNRDWRFYFTIEGAEYHLHEIKRHPK
jgi:hypothetical protein